MPTKHFSGNRNIFKEILSFQRKLPKLKGSLFFKGRPAQKISAFFRGGTTKRVGKNHKKKKLDEKKPEKIYL